MALRFLLVSLVAGMGCELPSQTDVAAWARTGREWVDARVGDTARLKVEAELALAGLRGRLRARSPTPVAPRPTSVEVPSTRDDLAFEAVVEKMASDFAADLAAIEESKPEDEAVVVVEPFREMPPAAWTDPEPAAPAFEEVAEAPAEVSAPPRETPASRSEKISAAVRLTKQALGAWASLIQPPTVRVAAEGRDGHALKRPRSGPINRQGGPAIAGSPRSRFPELRPAGRARPREKGRLPRRPRRRSGSSCGSPGRRRSGGCRRGRGTTCPTGS